MFRLLNSITNKEQYEKCLCNQYKKKGTEAMVRVGVLLILKSLGPYLWGGIFHWRL